MLKIDFEENVSSSDDINPSIGLLLPIVVTGGLQLDLVEVEVNNRLHNRLQPHLIRTHRVDRQGEEQVRMMPDASFDRVNGEAGVEVLFFSSDYHFPFDHLF